jgi:demethylmenaquinone methyltransferase / 2-methoxy-6-polyprenyl-1,4-benzoquinol methylase
MVRAQLDKRPGDVAAMFDRVAGRYDLMNDVLSLGLDRQWRRAVAASLDARPGELILDLAAGTGTVSAILARSGARCVACDFSLGMLQVGAARLENSPGVGFAAGDALALPFADGSFDAVTISFGLRNVADPQFALAEMRRVTRPGGRVLICEFSHLPHRTLDGIYDKALTVMLPLVARGLSGNPEAYDYLAESIGAWPGAAQLGRVMQDAGWSKVRWRMLTGGIVALHHAVNPG